ncbi:MAG TPA: putative lipid II flippase FtsW [Thermomicrobiales bacterium]|nr:putative lipid II flippase FtsW [Thermomicrobiales bacterium]
MTGTRMSTPRGRARARYHDPEWWLLSVLLMLVMFGTVMVFSASFPDVAVEEGLARYSVLVRQLVYVAVGCAGLIVAMRIDYHAYYRHSFWMMLGIVALLMALVFMPGVGTEVFGAKRWIIIGPLSFQPSELAKPLMILYMASWLSAKGKRVTSFSHGLVQFSVVMGLLVGLVMLEPDLGTSALLVTVGVAMFFVAGAQPVQFASFLILGATAFLTMALSAPYRRERIFVFLNPDADVQNLGWQLYQARLALGSGGLLGLGLGASRQKFSWLPAAHNDAIFAVIGEELGLIGCGFVVMLFCAIAYRGYKIATRAPDSFGTLIAVGITTWLIFQAAFNIGGITTAIPFTGIPLPFISAGGTSLVVSMTALGVLLNVSRQTLSAAELAPTTEGGRLPRKRTATRQHTREFHPTRRRSTRAPSRPAPMRGEAFGRAASDGGRSPGGMGGGSRR